jgi:transcriptional regulator with XRE-family HTH domain
MIRVEIEPELLRWARERSGLDRAALTHRFPQLDAWERLESSPTLKQLEGFAKATHTPVGYLFLREPPVERVPIPDFRTAGNKRIGHPSPDLLDTVYLCQQRQEWYRDFARSDGVQAVPFVGSARAGAVRAGATNMTQTREAVFESRWLPCHILICSSDWHVQSLRAQVGQDALQTAPKRVL